MFEHSLNNKIVLVTGASRGIGRAIAIAMAKAGATVIGTVTTAKGAQEIAASLQTINKTQAGMILDVTSQASIDQLCEEVKVQFGSINILVNNAAITKDNLFMRMKESEWMEVINTDLNAIFRLSKSCIRDMIKARWGRIINIGSVAGTMGNPGQANYCAAKAGLIGFSKSVALEVASRNITVNTVSPGFIETDMTHALTAEQRNTIFERIPTKRPGKVEDIAQAVLYLASPAGDYITGQTLHVNGGLHMI